MDYSITMIQAVEPHPNADRLDIATVLGWRCVVAKDSLKVGDEVVYIAPDAQILNPEAPWCEGFRSYLGGSGRVRTTKIRGVYSEGIVLPNKDIVAMFKLIDPSILIQHYEPPAPPASLAGLMRGPSLPYHLAKTDQENVQSLPPVLYLGKPYYVTRKMDGSSCTITFETKTQEVHVTSRSIDLKLEGNDDNAFIKATKPIVEHLKAYSPTERNFVLILRGEVCSEGIQRKKINKDAKGEPTFNLFEARYHDLERMSEPVFLDIFGGYQLPTNDIPYLNELKTIVGNIVPVVEVVDALSVCTIERYLNAPASEGEGVVLWTKNLSVNNHSFKIKSKDYDSKL